MPESQVSLLDIFAGKESWKQVQTRKNDLDPFPCIERPHTITHTHVHGHMGANIYIYKYMCVHIWTHM